jgi:anti-anti-sigma factor
MKKRSSSAPKAKKNDRAAGGSATRAPQHTIAVAGESGWASAEELKERAVDALNTSAHIALDFSRIDYVEAGGLQVVLAIRAACVKTEKSLELVNVSPELRGWFEQCGGAEHLFSSAVNQ